MKAPDGREIYGISGGPIERFREGWAILPMVGERPHYWMRAELSNRYRAMCGLSGSVLTHEEAVKRGMPHFRGVQPLGPGDFMDARCSHCQRKRQKQARRREGR